MSHRPTLENQPRGKRILSLTPSLALFLCALLGVGQLAQAAGTVTGATAAQMQGAVSQGKVIGQGLGTKNPLQQPAGAATSFSASPYGSAPDVGQTGFASNADYKVTFNCATKPPIYIAGNTVRIGDCTTSGTGANAQVQSINLSVCTTSSSGGQCGPTDFSPNTTVFVGQATILTPSTMGAMILSCPADGSLKCTGDLVLRATLAVSGAQLASQGSAAAQGMATQQMLTSTYNNGAYQAEIQTAGPGLNTCYQGQVQSGLESDGTVHTCDGKQSVNFVADQCPAPTEQCVQYATQTNNWNTSCNVDVPIDVKTCNAVTPTRDCAVTMPKQNFICNKVLTTTVTQTGGGQNYCTPGQLLGHFSYYGVNVYVYCNSATTYRVYMPGFSGSNSNTTAYPALSANTFGRTWGGAYGYQGGNCWETVYLTQACTGTSCALTGNIVAGCGSPSAQSISLSTSTSYFTANPGVSYTYSDSWDDQCTTYEAAP